MTHDLSPRLRAYIHKGYIHAVIPTEVLVGIADRLSFTDIGFTNSSTQHYWRNYSNRRSAYIKGSVFINDDMHEVYLHPELDLVEMALRYGPFEVIEQ